MKAPTKIFLVGPMGAGKTTIGRQLADCLGLEFIDLDEAIEESCGANITWIFDVEGEEGFRRRESELLEQLTQQDNIVLATGGGAILNEQNRQCLSERGLVIYLRTSITQLLERTRLDKKRPLLQVSNPRAVFEKLLAEREPLYDEVADIVMRAKNKRIQSSVTDLVNKIQAYC